MQFKSQNKSIAIYIILCLFSMIFLFIYKNWPCYPITLMIKTIICSTGDFDIHDRDLEDQLDLLSTQGRGHSGNSDFFPDRKGLLKQCCPGKGALICPKNAGATNNKFRMPFCPGRKKPATYFSKQLNATIIITRLPTSPYVREGKVFFKEFLKKKLYRNLQ